MNWDEVTARCAAFGLMGTAFAIATRAIVRDEIKKLNGTYLRKELADVKFREIEAHFDYLRDLK
jgi:hypothetical protein